MGRADRVRETNHKRMRMNTRERENDFGKHKEFGDPTAACNIILIIHICAIIQTHP